MWGVMFTFSPFTPLWIDRSYFTLPIPVSGPISTPSGNQSELFDFVLSTEFLVMRKYSSKTSDVIVSPISITFGKHSELFYFMISPYFAVNS